MKQKSVKITRTSWETIDYQTVNLFSGDPVECHLRAHVVVQCPVWVVSHHLLAWALPFTHRFEWPVPVQQLKYGHELLEFEHRSTFVCLEHEAKRSDASVGVICLVRIALRIPNKTNIQMNILNILKNQKKQKKCNRRHHKFIKGEEKSETCSSYFFLIFCCTKI